MWQGVRIFARPFEKVSSLRLHGAQHSREPGAHVGILNHFIVVYPQLLELFITTCLLQTLTLFHSHMTTKPLCGDGDLDLNTGLDVDDDLLDDLGGRVEIDETWPDLLASSSPLP
jgi:hypothetical protein